MDALLIILFNLLGICSYALAVLAQRAPMGLTIFSYFAAALLVIDCINLISHTSAYSLFEWTGKVEMSPFMAVLVLIGLIVWHEGGNQWKKTEKSARS